MALAQSKLLKALGIAEEAASNNYMYRSTKVCVTQSSLLVSAFGEVRNFLTKLRSEGSMLIWGAAVELERHVVWDPLIVGLRTGLELLNSCKTDDWVVRSLLCHESREDFLDVHAELFSCVELLSAWLLEQLNASESQQRSVVREAWASFSRTRTEHRKLEDAARIDREQLLTKAFAEMDRTPKCSFRLWKSQPNHQPLQLLSDVLLDNIELDKRFAIDHRQIKLRDHISQGAYADIYEAHWLGRAFAVKVFLSGEDTSFPKELAALATHKHPNILRVVGHSYDKRKTQYSLVMDKMDMNLTAFLKMRGEVLPLAESLDILIQISKAMAWLHSKEVIHRDLKPENILVSQSWGGEQLAIKVSDFGLARTNFLTSRNVMVSPGTIKNLKRGTKVFMAPEVLNSDYYTKKTDVYSFAVLSYHVLTGLPPFRDIYEKRDFMDLVSSGSRPMFPAGMLKEVTDLVESCWIGNAEERPDFTQIRDDLTTMKATTLIGSSFESAQAALLLPVPDLTFNYGAGLIFVEGAPYKFSLNEVLSASAKVLAKETFGTVCKASLRQHSVNIRVVKLKGVSVKHLDRQLQRISKLRHPNVAPLWAYHIGKDENWVLYDYLPSLSDLLQDNSLDWGARLRIALAAARGVAYLHAQGADSVHGSINANNILRGFAYDAVVSSCGLQQLVVDSACSASSKLTQEADVYDFGIVLLQLLTSMDDPSLQDWVYWVPDMFDPKLLIDKKAQGGMEEMLDLALTCVRTSPEQRPKMKDVVNTVESILAIG